MVQLVVNPNDLQSLPGAGTNMGFEPAARLVLETEISEV
jgi:hypothetical protein